MVSTALVLVGMVGVLLWANYWWTKNQAAEITRKAMLTSEIKLPLVQQLPSPIKIKIPGLVDASIVPGVVFEGNWSLSEKEAVYITQSARPGEKGNIIVYGHNTNSLFGNIRYLRGNEKISLTLSDGNKRDYRVDKMLEIKPEDVWVVEPTNYEVLTLYTCSGFADTKRFVVRAIPIDR